MSLTTSAWSRPIQGVSQQPPKIRLEGQATMQENAISSVVSGLVKRPGTARVNTVSKALPEGTKYHYYNRGTGEEYFIAIPPNSLPRVFDKEGVELTVEVDSVSESYLKAAKPITTFRLSTISDFTFIVNRDVIPDYSSDRTPELKKEAIINCQFADYGREYKIILEDVVVASYKTPDGSTPEHIEDVATNVVAERLFNNTGGINRIYERQYDSSGNPLDNIYFEFTEYEAVYENVNTGTTEDPVYESQFQYYQANLPALSDIEGYTFSLRGNTIFVEKDDGGDFEISTEDGADGRDLFVVKNTVKQVADLPLYAPPNYKVEVIGAGNSNDDNYWLEAQSNEGSTVRWVESVGPDQSVGFDKSTMPVSLIRDRFENGRAVFVLREGQWGDRLVGNPVSNPMPSFVQNNVPLTSVGTFQNRLALTAGESVIYSRSNEFFDFFRSTVRTALDTDPIDVYADTNQVNYLENSEVLDGDIVFFSRNGQFLQDGKEPLTKSNATLQYASSFENIPECNPAASGDVIFFAFEYGRFTGIREFYTDSFTDTKRARPVTDHVDEYIGGRAKYLVTSTNKNQLLVLADDPTVIYVYNWLWQGNERVQSSWSLWRFDGNVRYMAYDNDTIYLLIERGRNLELEKIETGDPDDNGLTFGARLDRRVEVTATKTAGQWSATLPYLLRDQPLVVVRGEGCLDAGVTVTHSLVGTTINIEEDIADSDTNEAKIICGIPFDMKYEPTMPFIKDRNGKVIDTDRLTINDVNINYDKTGLTRIIVENDWNVVREYSFNGRRIGGFSNVVGFAPIRPGNYTFPIRQQSERVVFRLITDSHIPFQLRDMEWRGRFNQRGRRV